MKSTVCGVNFKQYAYTSLFWCFRNDEKTAQDYKVQGGSVLHLVLALRGGHLNLKL